jgi:pilus assembly protein Flp/PilA
MTNMIAFLQRLNRDERGSAAVEYGLIVALIVIGILTGVQDVGTQTGLMWQDVTDKVSEKVG